MGKIREFPLMLEKVDAQSSYDAETRWTEVKTGSMDRNVDQSRVLPIKFVTMPCL